MSEIHFKIPFYPFNGWVKIAKLHCREFFMNKLHKLFYSHAFAGFVLSFAKARVLWSSSLVPFYFLLMAALSGLALVVIFDTIRYALVLNRTPGAQDMEKPIFHQLGTALYVLIFADLGLILCYLVKLGTSPELFSQVMDLMAAGKMGPAELLLPVIFGLVAPLFLLLFPKTVRTPWAQCAASLLIVLGNFSMGSIVLSAAQGVPLL